MQPITESQLKGTFPVFLMEVLFSGRTFRFSTFPVQIENDTSTIQFEGGLEDPDLRETLEEFQDDPESNSLAVEVVFPINLLEYQFKLGQSLENCEVELSMVFERKGEIQQSYSERIKLFSGSITQPIIGAPGQPVGYAAFSVERDPKTIDVFPIQEKDKIIDMNYDLIPTAPGNIKSTEGLTEGKYYPFVFGRHEGYFGWNAITRKNVQKQVFSTPAYIVQRRNPNIVLPESADNDYDVIYLVIAGHPVEADEVTVIDWLNHQITKPVWTEKDGNGNLIAFVKFAPYELVGVAKTAKDYPFASPFQESNPSSEPKYIVKWTSGGGFLNPFGPGVLEGAGDIIKYFLTKTQINVDLGAWDNASSYLNAYKFSGFINDPEVSYYDYILDNLLPFIPVEIVNGFDGLRPIIPLLFDNLYSKPLASIELNESFSIQTAIVQKSDSKQICNHISLLYARDLIDGTYRGSVTLRGDPKIEQTGTNIPNYGLEISYNRFGTREKTIEAQGCYEFQSALLMALYVAKKDAFPKLNLEVQANTLFGWLNVGDIIALNSEEYFWRRLKAQIVGKKWLRGSWVFNILLEDNPTNLRRL